ncbi:MAG TPA: ABC transporter ATP-binding protein [Fibrobacteria bacterium]|nr:ABC transporter ATP-binding protein [Fibrobacteria bacterium]
MPHLKLEGLSKVYPGGVKALDGFSLDIAEREFVAVVGPSGCGKSTLLRLIAGLDEESGGKIVLDGAELNGLPPRDRDMAIMFQNYALFPHMTVAANMAFGLKLRGTPREEIDKRVQEAARMLGIVDLLARFPGEMSGGQRQRAALGRAILRRPKVFLFDEPLSNLDAKMRAQMRVEISRLHQSLPSTMIFVTHDQVEAMTMGDRVVVLKDGVIQQAADPDTLYKSPANAFVASFIGSPGMNLFAGRIGEVTGSPAFIHPLFSWKLPDPLRARLAGYAGRDVLFGVRPEDIGSAAARRSQDAPAIRGSIGVVERLGGQACLYLEGLPDQGSAGIAFAARPEDATGCRSGQVVELPVSAAQGRFFDPASGAALA